MKKRLISLLLTVVMLLPLVVVPTNAALVAGTGTLTITPNVTSVPGSASAPIEVIYTIKVTPPAEGPVGEFHFNLKAPDGMTLADAEGEQGKEGYWVNPTLSYHKTYNKEGIFETFEYTPSSKYFQAFGTSASRNMTAEADIMTIKATIAAGKVGDFTLTAENVGINKDGTDSYSVDVKTTPVTISKAPISSVSFTLTDPAQGAALPSLSGLGSGYIGAVEWYEGTGATGSVVTGNAKPNQVYTAKITLTAGTGESFADSVIIPAGYTKDSSSTNSKLVLTKTFPTTATATLTSISVVGTTTIAVPTAGPQATTTNTLALVAQGKYDDSTTAPVNANWEIVGTTPTGVSISGSNLTVTNKANAGTVNVKAIFDGKTATKDITITKNPAKETKIVLTAPSSTTIDVPTGSGMKNNSGKCTAKVYDQYGNPITSAGVTYESDPATMPTGVTFAPSTGEFFVDNTAQNGTVKVIAKYGTVTSNPVAFTIKRAAGTVNSVTLSGSAPALTVPEANGPENPKSKTFTNTYTATVKDQFGVTMPGESVSWSVSGNAGVKINSSTGELTISSNATADSVTITATYKGKSDSKTVSVTRTTPAAKWVKITGQSGSPAKTQFVIPTATGAISETSNSYEATVYDQYGKDYSENVNWSLYPSSVTGVTMEMSATNSNVVTIKVGSNASAGNFDIIATSSSSSAVNGKINLTLTNKTAKTLTVNMNGITYGTQLPDPTYDSVSGILSHTKKVTYVGTGSTSYTESSTKPKNAGTYKVNITFETPTEIYSGSAPFTIAQKEVTVAPGTYKVSKEYDTTTTAGTGKGDLSVNGIVDSGVSVKATPVAYTSANVDGQSNVNVNLALSGTGSANYKLAASTISVPCSITPAKLTVTGATVAAKTYNGSTDATVSAVTFSGMKGSDSLTVGTDYMVSGVFNSANVNDANNVIVTVTLKNTTLTKNYKLASSTYNQAATISQAPTPAAPTGLTGIKGNLLNTVALPTGWTWVNGTQKMEEAGVDKPFGAHYEDPNGNYAPNISGTPVLITVLAKNDVNTKITFPNGSLVYNGNGQKYEKASISGITASGTAEWTYTYAVDPSTATATLDSGLPLTVGKYTVTATYEDSANYGTATATLEITPAKPTVTPKFDKITEKDKTLANANLTIASSSPVGGKIEWVDDAGAVLPGTTTVEANKAYKWRYTPLDTTNYAPVYGTIVVYPTSTGIVVYCPHYTIKASAGANGTISPAGWCSVAENGSQTFTFTPDKGYSVAKVLVDGKSVGAVKSYTFKDVTKDHTIEVIFMKSNGNPATGVFVMP